MFFKKLMNKGYEADYCQVCNNPFKLIKFDRIHKCKRCHKMICINCGSQKQNIMDDEKGKMTLQKHRVCIKCKSDIQNIKQSMEYYDLKWDRNSRLGLQWLAKLYKYHVDYQYSHFLNLFFKSGERFKQETEIIDKDVIKGRTDFSVFNYSMKEFFFTVQLSVQDQHTTRLNIANVLYAIAARYDRIGYVQGMSGIAAFLLCFADQQTAYIIFCDLLQNIFPSMFFERSSFGVSLIGLLAQIYFLKAYFEHFVMNIKKNLLFKERQPYNEDQMNHFKVIVQLAGTKALLSIFIGILSFSNLLFVWEQLKSKRNFQVVQKAFLAIIYLNRQAILEQRSFKKLQQYFEKQDSESFKQAYHDIEIDQQLRNAYVAQFYSQNDKKWNSSGAANAYTLSKVTKLTEADIKLLEKQFCPKFTPAQMASKIIIHEQNFVKLVELYYKVLQKQSSEGESILEISSYFVRKIYKSHTQIEKDGLNFRQFICCFSLCTKSTLKQRISTIVNTFKDNDCKVSFENFNKLFQSLSRIAPSALQLKKADFIKRMNKFFAKTGKISLSEVDILLNDEFIFDCSQFVCFESKDIISKVLTLYKQYKQTLSSKNESDAV